MQSKQKYKPKMLLQLPGVVAFSYLGKSNSALLQKK